MNNETTELIERATTARLEMIDQNMYGWPNTVQDLITAFRDMSKQVDSLDGHIKKHCEIEDKQYAEIESLSKQIKIAEVFAASQNKLAVVQGKEILYLSKQVAEYQAIGKRISARDGNWLWLHAGAIDWLLGEFKRIAAMGKNDE